MAVVAAVGVLLVLAGSVGTVIGQRWIATAETADGQVVNLDEDYSCSGSGNSRSCGYTYHPEVQYVTADGETRQFRSSGGSNPPMYQVGDRVQVLYDPADPNDARLDNWLDRWGASPFMLVVGLVFVAAAAPLFLRRRTAEWDPLPDQGATGQASERGRAPITERSRQDDPLHRGLWH